MITLIIGGEEGDERVERVWPSNKRPKLLFAIKEGSFHKFCAAALESTKILTRLNRNGDRLPSFAANDDFAVHFCDAYLTKHLDKYSVMYKIATAVETSLDLGLDIEVIVVGDKVEAVLKDMWPNHWPERQILDN